MLGWACCCLSSAVLLHCFWSDNDAPSRALRTAGRVSGAWCARACRIPARAATATCARLFNRRFKCALIGVGFPVLRTYRVGIVSVKSAPFRLALHPFQGCGVGWTMKHPSCSTSQT
ncbi:hypothetical protein ABFS83_07G109000 [Erythranthe nasuta]